MKKFLFFDFDDTLSFNKEPVSAELITELRRLSEKYTVVIATGQSAFYISGALRQMGGMDNVSIIAENGGVVYSDFKNPPIFNWAFKADNETIALFKYLKNELIRAYGESNLFFSEHTTVLNVCPRFDCQREEIFEFFNSKAAKNNLVFKNTDTVEILPGNINKATGIQKFLEIKGVEKEEIISYAFGDSKNDIKMFEYCDHAHLVGDKIHLVKKHVKLAGEKELLEYLRDNF